jgi:hypothetical protein
LSPSFKYLFGLDSEPKGNFGFPVEEMVAEQATEFTLWPSYGNQLNAAVASIAFGTGDIGFLHEQESYHPAPIVPTEGSGSV